MRHIIFFYHIAAFLAGITVIFVSAAGYLKFRKPAYKHYSLFMLALTLFLIDQTGASYRFVSMITDKYAQILLSLVTATGYAIMIYSLPRFTHEFFDYEMEEKRKDLFSILAIVLPVGAITLYYTMTLWILVALAFNGILVGSVLYSLWIARKNYPRIQDDYKKLIVRRFCVLTYICIPYISLDMFIEKLPVVGGYFPYGILSVPTFYFLWSILTLYFAFKSFDSMNIAPGPQNDFERDATSTEVSDLEAFSQKYGITNREKEVVELIKKGYSYNKICEELVVSLPTVKSHVYNIYQKTGVKNRVELINLINSAFHTKV